jgi:hypothetical protein
MIPKHMKKAATLVVIICFAIVVAGFTLGALWISIYAPR